MAKKSTAHAATVRVTQIRSAIGFNRSQAEVIRGLGLRRIGHSVDLQDVPSIRGMIHKVRHLVTVDDGPDAGAPRVAKAAKAMRATTAAKAAKAAKD